MNDCEYLAKQYDLALNGEAWHGPSWQEVLKGVSAAAAARRPIPKAHSIAEIVNHIATWNEIVRLRLAGESPTAPDDDGWQDTGSLEKDAWDAARERLFASGAALRDAVKAFPPERLHKKRPGTDGSWQDLVLGQLQHLVCHCGQVALLKKAS